ncbi:MAG: glycosyltransferase family 4 protein [Acidimicrobiales bacterium]|nr:glycosyltransferase family 4 protein [Acidimicrobiales bacterium]
MTPRLLHIATTDMSLELLLGPQLLAFTRAGYDVHTAAGAGGHADAVRAAGHTHHVLEHATRAFSPTQDVRALGELYRLFRSVRPDIVHTHNPKPGIYGRMAAKAARVPLIVNTQHGLYAQPTDRGTRRLPVYLLERLAAACSDVELIQSREDLQTLRRLRVPERKLRLLGNGIDLTRFRPPTATTRADVRRALGYGEDDVVCGAVGRLVWEKGYRELFRAASELLPRLPHLRMLVIGPFDDDKADLLRREDVEAAEAAGVRFLGHRHDVEDLYGAMDFYVLASHREGFPRSAMEASASGLPVIATDIRGCREVVVDGDNGILVPVRDADALATAIETLATDDGSRRRMGEAAARRANSHFDQQQLIDITLDAYAALPTVP